MDNDEIESLRDSAVHLVQHTETAVLSFKRACAWRNATRSSSTGSIEQLGPPMSLPYPYLAETIHNLSNKLKAQLGAAQDLEITINEKSKSSFHRPSDGDATLSALQSTIATLHDCLFRVAAMLKYLDDKVGSAKVNALKEMQKTGATSDPFRKAEADEKMYRSTQSSSVAKAFNEMNRAPVQGMMTIIALNIA